MKFTRGPYEILTDTERAGRETLVRLEEFRHGIGQIIGEDDLQTPEPLRVFVFKNPRGWTTAELLMQGRDRLNVVLGEKGTISPALYSELTKHFLRSNTNRMPERFERGLIEFFSRIQVTGIRITLDPPPQPDLDWARIHLLVTDPEYFGKIRVLLYNLRKGVAEDAAYRNAFGKSPAEIEAHVQKHFAARNFQTATLSSRPMAANDFPERAVSDADARLARADLLAGAQSAAEYASLIAERQKVPESEEGLGLLALREKKNDEARKHFEAAMAAESTSARCFIEYAKLEPDNEKARQALLRAAGINGKLDEPFALMAARDTDPRLRAAHWKAAAERNPRNLTYWQKLAEAHLEQHNFGEAAKAWTQAEQAASTPAEREKMHRARMEIEEQRLDYETAEKRRAAEEEAAELEKLKTKAREELHAAEAKANSGAPKSDGKAVPWWTGPQPSGKVTGTLKQIDCLGKQARLVIEDEGRKLVRLLITDPGQISITGGGEQTLGCGPQKARKIAVEYFPKANSRLTTAGEVATIEFR